MIAAASGWRVCLWSRESDDVIGLPIVAWEVVTRETPRAITYTNMEPWFLTEDHMAVQRLSDRDLFVGIMEPGDELHDWHEAGLQVRVAEEEAEERAARQRLREAEAADPGPGQ